MASVWRQVAEVESETKIGVRYAIKVNTQTGERGCGCASFRFSKAKPKTCKHLIGLYAISAAHPVPPVRASGIVDQERVVVQGEALIVRRRAISFDEALT